MDDELVAGMVSFEDSKRAALKGAKKPDKMAA